MKYISFLTLVFAVSIQVFFDSHSAKAQTYHPRYAPGTIIYAPQYNINIYSRSGRPHNEPSVRRVYQEPDGTYRQVVYRRPVSGGRRPVYSNRIPALVQAPRVRRGMPPTYSYVAQRRAVGSGGICARIANPVSRRACLCSVANGGIAQLLPNGQIGWTRHNSGPAYHGTQRCMGTL